MLSSTSRAASRVLRSRPAIGSVLIKRSYHENIVEHYENPRNVGSLDKNESSVGTVGHSDLCFFFCVKSSHPHTYVVFVVDERNHSLLAPLGCEVAAMQWCFVFGIQNQQNDAVLSKNNSSHSFLFVGLFVCLLFIYCFCSLLLFFFVCRASSGLRRAATS